MSELQLGEITTEAQRAILWNGFRDQVFLPPDESHSYVVKDDMVIEFQDCRFSLTAVNPLVTYEKNQINNEISCLNFLLGTRMSAVSDGGIFVSTFVNPCISSFEIEKLAREDALEIVSYFESESDCNVVKIFSQLALRNI